MSACHSTTTSHLGAVPSRRPSTASRASATTMRTPACTTGPSTRSQIRTWQAVAGCASVAMTTRRDATVRGAPSAGTDPMGRACTTLTSAARATASRLVLIICRWTVQRWGFKFLRTTFIWNEITFLWCIQMSLIIFRWTLQRWWFMIQCTTFFYENEDIFIYYLILIACVYICTETIVWVKMSNTCNKIYLMYYQFLLYNFPLMVYFFIMCISKAPLISGCQMQPSLQVRLLYLYCNLCVHRMVFKANVCIGTSLWENSA